MDGNEQYYLHEEGLLLAPHGYPIEADGVVTNMDSIADGNTLVLNLMLFIIQVLFMMKTVIFII